MLGRSVVLLFCGCEQPAVKNRETADIRMINRFLDFMFELLFTGN
jgi:hypothetical protein